MRNFRFKMQCLGSLCYIQSQRASGNFEANLRIKRNFFVFLRILCSLYLIERCPVKQCIIFFLPCIAASRSILALFELYGRPKNAPKKVLVTLFPYTFHLKRKGNKVYEYLRTKIFSRDSNILPQMH